MTTMPLLFGNAIQPALAANRRASFLAKFREGGCNLRIGRKFSGIERGHRSIDDLQLVPSGLIFVVSQLAFDLASDGNKFILGLFGPSLNALQQISKIGCGHFENIARTAEFSNRPDGLLMARAAERQYVQPKPAPHDPE